MIGGEGEANPIWLSAGSWTGMGLHKEYKNFAQKYKKIPYLFYLASKHYKCFFSDYPLLF